jgi:Ca2+/Na+ antiporter
MRQTKLTIFLRQLIFPLVVTVGAVYFWLKYGAENLWWIILVLLILAFHLVYFLQSRRAKKIGIPV